MKNSKWKNNSSEVHGLRSIPCIPLLSLFAGALAAAFTICINLEGEHSVHDLSTSSASLLWLLSATSLGDILMDIRIILICIERHPRFSLHQWRLETTTHYGKEDKEDNQVFWKKVSQNSALEAKAANGDFTDNAAARVHTSRGMPKMQPSTSSRSKTIAAGISPRQTLRAVG